MADDLDGGDECPARIVAVIQSRINRFRIDRVAGELTGATLGFFALFAALILSADQRIGKQIRGQPDAERDENDGADTREHFCRGRIRSGRVLRSFDPGPEISRSVGA
jgi:hypothetical protein